MLITWLQCTSPSLSATLANEALQDSKEQREILKQQGQRWCCLRVFNVFLFVAWAFSFHTQRRFFPSILDLPLPYFPHAAFFLHTSLNALQQTASSYCQKKPLCNPNEFKILVLASILYKQLKTNKQNHKKDIGICWPVCWLLSYLRHCTFPTLMIKGAFKRNFLVLGVFFAGFWTLNHNDKSYLKTTSSGR